MTAPDFQPDPWTLMVQIGVNNPTQLTLRSQPGGVDGCTLGLGPLIAVQLSQRAEDYLRHLLNVREGRRVAAARAERRERADLAAPPLSQSERAAMGAAVIHALNGRAPQSVSQVVAFTRRPFATEPTP